jgi:O-antigen ligase
MSDGMTILFMLGIYWFKESGRRKMLLGIALIAVAIPPLLIATVRTNWMAVVVGIFLYLFYLRLEKTWIKVGIMILLSVGLIGYSLKGGSTPQYSVVAQQRTNTKSLTEIMIKNRTSGMADPLAEYSVQKRIATWTSIYGESFLYPLGKGQGTTGYAHSYYFQVLGEIGYPGILLFLTILVVGFYRGFRILALSRDPEIRELTRLMLTLIFMISFLNLTGTHLHTPPGDIFFWFTMGTISRFYRQTLTDNATIADAEKKAAENTGIPETASNQIAGEALA